MTLNEVYETAYINKLAEFGLTPDMLEKDAAISDAKKLFSFITAANSGKGIGKTMNGLRSVLGKSTNAAKSWRDSLRLSSFTPEQLAKAVAAAKSRGVDMNPLLGDLVRQAPKAVAKLYGEKPDIRGVTDAIAALRTANTAPAREVGKINKVINNLETAQFKRPSGAKSTNALRRFNRKRQILSGNEAVRDLESKTIMPSTEQRVLKNVANTPEQAHRVKTVDTPTGPKLAPNDNLLHGDVGEKLKHYPIATIPSSSGSTLPVPVASAPVRSSRSNLWKYLLGGAGVAGALGAGAYAATSEPEPQGLSGLYNSARKSLGSLFG